MAFFRNTLGFRAGNAEIANLIPARLIGPNRMLTAADVRRLDLNSAWRGVPTGHLMDNAGRAAAEVAWSRFHPRGVLVLAGLGNNGGDGLVAARHLSSRAQVTVLLAGTESRVKASDARTALAALDRRTIRIEPWRTPERFRELARDADLLVDALLGVGVRGPLEEPIRTIVRVANAWRKPILSIDVPTGLGGPQAIRPALTVTLHGRKQGMTRANSGTILVRPIGIPPQAETHIGPGDLAVPYPRNAPDSHKGDNGRLLVVAGGPYCGAPQLAAVAALRTGADLVRLYTPQECARAAQTSHPDLIVHPGAAARRLEPEDLDGVAPLLAKVDAVLLGPGIGTDRQAQELSRSLILACARRRLPLVLDADAHVAARRVAPQLRQRPVLVTPHAGEFRDLTGKRLPAGSAQRERMARAEAARLGLTILLKGPLDVITDGRRTKLGDVHHPWMTAGGTGDVLAGICGALVAKGLDAYPAACAGAFLNGAAGLRAFEKNSWGARASDLLQEVPRVLRDWLPSAPSTVS